MMEKKFTPGEWVVDYKGSRGHIKSVGCHPKDWTPTICIYEDQDDDFNAIESVEERNANARLMAAAPDLLKALEAVIHYDSLDNHENMADFAEMVIAYSDMIGMAKRAIAKAYGESV